MKDTCWHEETKLLIEKAVQNELNTMHDKKLVSDKISQGMAHGGVPVLKKCTTVPC